MKGFEGVPVNKHIDSLHPSRRHILRQNIFDLGRGPQPAAKPASAAKRVKVKTKGATSPRGDNPAHGSTLAATR